MGSIPLFRIKVIIMSLCRHFNNPNNCPHCDDYVEVVELKKEIKKLKKELEDI